MPFNSGEILHAADLNQPVARVSRSTNQSIPNNTITSVSFDTEDEDTDGMWSSGTDVTIQTAGLYLITGALYWDNNGTRYRAGRVGVNGITVVGESGAGAANLDVANFNQPTTIQRLASGDVLTLQAAQNSGGALDIISGNRGGIHLEVVRLLS